MSEQIIKIGDCRELIKDLLDNSIDCVVTSSPYWQKRDYKTQPLLWEDGWKGSLGQEPTPQLFVKHLVGIFTSLKPKLKDSGSIWVNLGDSYSSSTKGDNRKPEEFSGKVSTLKFGENGDNCFGNPSKVETGLPDKCLCLIPERFAISMVDNGFILRNVIIWYKKNAMPGPWKDRLTNSYEYVYHFVKKTKYFYDLDLIREPLSISSLQRISQPNVMNQKGGFKQDELRGNPTSGNASRCNKMVQSLAMKYGNANTGINNKEPYTANNPHRTRLYKGKFTSNSEDCEEYGSPRARTQRKNDGTGYGGDGCGFKNHSGYYDGDGNLLVNPIGKNPGDVWIINTKPYSEAHFAVYPIDLIKKPILATCPKYICKKCGKPKTRLYKSIPLPESSLSYDSKYKNNDIGQTSQTSRTSTIERERDESRTKAKELYPDDPEAQQEYINFVHDHGGATRQEFIGYSDCGCNAQFDSGWVLDPFCGSGTTLEFCRKNGYNAIGMELNPSYRELIIDRAMINTLHVRKINNAQEI